MGRPLLYLRPSTVPYPPDLVTMDSAGYHETCHCGHDRTSHYVDLSFRPPYPATCLARGCECVKYANWRVPRPATVAVTTDPEPPQLTLGDPSLADMWGGVGGFGWP